LGWNLVRKRIKGKVYLYRQRSYRDGDKVRTENIYIGPAGDTDTVVSSQDRPSGSESTHDSSDKVGQVSERETWIEPKPHHKPTPPPIDLPIEGGSDPKRMLDLLEEDGPKVRRRKKPWERVQPTSDTVVIKKPAQELNFAELPLHAEEKRVKNRMRKMGLSVDDLKPMIVATAKKVGWKKKSKGYHVYAQAGGGKRKVFRTEYRHALSERWLDQYMGEDPVGFSHLRADLDESYRNTRTALTQYVLRGKMNNRRWLTLQMMWSKRAPEWLRDHIKPEHLGLIDHGALGSWREEAVHITGELIRAGSKKTAQKYARNAVVAKRAAGNEWEKFQAMGLIDRLKGRRRSQYRKAKQADARMKATAEMSRKVTILRGHLFKA